MRSREARSALPGTDQAHGLRQWWLDRSLRTKGLIVVTLPLVALMGLTAANLLATTAIPVVILSADASHGVIRRLLAGGAFAYLTKPIELAELGKLLDTVVAARAQAQQAQPAIRITPA
jgi:CheY-like chemotaxis protein